MRATFRSHTRRRRVSIEEGREKTHRPLSVREIDYSVALEFPDLLGHDPLDVVEAFELAGDEHPSQSNINRLDDLRRGGVALDKYTPWNFEKCIINAPE